MMIRRISVAVSDLFVLRFRERAKQHFKPISFRRFLESYKEYTDAVVVEAELRERKQVPPVEEYRTFRRMNGAVKPCFDIIEACFDIELPDEVFNMVNGNTG